MFLFLFPALVFFPILLSYLLGHRLKLPKVLPELLFHVNVCLLQVFNV